MPVQLKKNPIKKLIYLFLLISLLLVPLVLPSQITATVSQENLFTNSGFETDLSGWEQSNWWQEGGILGTNVVAAYQPKGASSLANSYINIANPGTHDLTTTAAPVWNAENGWGGNGISTYLDTGILFDSLYSSVMRFSDLVPDMTSSSVLLGTYSSGRRFQIGLGYIESDYMAYSWGGTTLNVAPFLNSGTVASTPNKAYRDGILDANINGVWTPGVNPVSLYLLAYHNVMAGGAVANVEANVQSSAIYNSELTPDQVLAIHNAMLALDSTITRDISVKHSGVASTKIIAANNYSYSQYVNTTNTGDHQLSAYVYIDGTTPVGSTYAQLFSNGLTIETTYTPAGDGWYLLSGTLTGANEPRSYGVQVKSGKTVYIDDLSLNAIEEDEPIVNVQVDMRITDIGKIANVPDLDTMSYYFTSTSVHIQGVTQAGNSVIFELSDELFTTTADSDGDFDITIVVSQGTNIFDYYAKDVSNNVSESRRLVLVVGTEYFPDWLLEDLGLLEPNTDDGHDPAENTFPIENVESDIQIEDSVQIVKILDEQGNALAGAEVEINGTIYTADVNGEISVKNLEEGKKYTAKVTYQGATYEVNVLGAENKQAIEILTLSADNITEKKTLSVWIYIVGGIFILSVAVVLITKKRI